MEPEQTSGPVVPHALQGEIARLDQKFKVSLVMAQQKTKDLKIVCCLDDKSLPCVPPLTVKIPGNCCVPQCLNLLYSTVRDY